jgi:cytochrome P450
LFNSGTHRCPGRDLSLVLLRLFLAAFVSSIKDLTLAEDSVLLKFDEATLGQTKNKVRIVLKDADNNS